jgi:hypothetical protein
MAAALIVKLDERASAPPQSTKIAWSIPTVDDCRTVAERAGLQIVTIDDRSRSFREVCARWRGALIVWDLVLHPQEPPDALTLS